MKNHLNWYIAGKNMKDEPVIYRANFREKITSNIEFYISYTISLTENNDWQFSIFYYLPDNIPPIVQKCHTIEVGKQMAEHELQKILNGMKNILSNYL